MSYSLDIESFISEVEKYPELWNVHSDQYKHKHKKLRAWSEIAKVFVEDYDDLTKRDKEEIYKKLFNKWRNIRDSYVRHLKKSYGKNGGYIYSNSLTFLSDVYKQNNNSGSDAEEQADQNEESWASDDSKKENVQTFVCKTECDTDLWQNEDVDTLDSASRKRQKTAVEFVDTTFTEAASCNEDKAFFDSLLPAVKDFTIDQKLEFRSDIIKLIKNYRQQLASKQ